MGKLVEKLQQIGQSSGSGLGFTNSRTPTRKGRPAGVFVNVRATDSAIAQAAVQQGVDGLIVSGWEPGTDVSAIKEAIGTTSVIWGVESAAEQVDGATFLKAIVEAGAGFAIFGRSASASVFVADVEKLDRVLTVDPPQDDMSLLLLRNQNVLAAQAVVLPLQLTRQQIAKLTVGEYTRLRVILESLRFPTLVTLKEAPEASSVATLVRLGADGFILPGEGASAAVIGEQVKALREELEKTPTRREESSTVLLGGMATAGGSGLTPPTRRDPEREPAPEPEHE